MFDFNTINLSITTDAWVYDETKKGNVHKETPVCDITNPILISIIRQACTTSVSNRQFLTYNDTIYVMNNIALLVHVRDIGGSINMIQSAIPTKFATQDVVVSDENGYRMTEKFSKMLDDALAGARELFSLFSYPTNTGTLGVYVKAKKS